MSFRTPMGRVIGLGSARDGTGHWWGQRLSAAAMIPLTLLAIWPLGAAIGSDREAVLLTYQNPWNAIVAVLFIAVAFHHLRAGLQVVIEDYVHAKIWRTALLIGSTWLCALFGLAGIFGVVRIAFGG